MQTNIQAWALRHTYEINQPSPSSVCNVEAIERPEPSSGPETNSVATTVTVLTHSTQTTFQPVADLSNHQDAWRHGGQKNVCFTRISRPPACLRVSLGAPGCIESHALPGTSALGVPSPRYPVSFGGVSKAFLKARGVGRDLALSTARCGSRRREAGGHATRAANGFERQWYASEAACCLPPPPPSLLLPER